jgi:tetratricopeptide (TPR) repeat protein
MAEVNLQDYCEEAKELIRSDSYDQAIAVCRHILEHFPKHITSYRLLGEACLEKGDYVEAANLFKRVLSVDLEDVIAYVGLGIIYDEQGALEEAIWQLERAFELTPGNAEIRRELQRLYQERDGTAPPRLRLTPAALGRLYLKEELYERAIDEFRGVLEEDPDRPDIQVALAQALWWSDQRREAAEVCKDILDKLPNCLKANLILGEILLNSDREEEGQTLLRKAQALDPENIVAQELFREQSPLPLHAVSVRRLEEEELEAEAKEISPAPPEEEAEPEEAPPPTDEAELEEAMPDWLRKLREGEKRSGDEEYEAPPQAEETPDWLRELEEGIPQGAEPTTLPSEEGLPTSEAEMPSWLRELEEASKPPLRQEPSLEGQEATPPEAVVDEEPSAVEEEETEIGEETMARLRETMPDESASIEETIAWLERATDMMAEETPSEEVAGRGVPPTEPVPGWLRELGPEAGAEEGLVPRAEEGEEIPDWLRALQEEAVEPPSAKEEEAPRVVEEATPTWLLQLNEETADEEITPRPEDTPSPPEAVTEEKPPLEEIEKEPPVIPAPEEELRAAEEEEMEISEETMARLRETMPDEAASIEEIMAWVERSTSIMADEKAPSDVAEVVEEEREPPPKEVEEVEATVEEEIPAWLRDLRAAALEEGVVTPPAGVEAPVEEAVAPSEEEAATWLRDQTAAAVEEEVAVPSAEVEAPVAEMAAPPEEEIPAWLREVRAEAAEEEARALAADFEPPAEEVAAAPEEEIPAWLRELRAEAVEEEARPAPEEAEALLAEVAPAPEEEIPAWLRELREQGVEEEAMALLEEVEEGSEEVAALPEEEIPAWLSELREQGVEEEAMALIEEVEERPEEVAAPPKEEIPAWLRELRAEGAEEEPVAPPREEAELVAAEEAIPPSFVEEQPLIEIVPVEEEAEPAPAVQEREKLVAEAAEVDWRIEDYLDHLVSKPDDAKARLALARAYLQERDLDEAVSHYSEIVSSATLLDLVIDDLEATADDAPEHLPTHELLADAYMKDGRLQKALDKYRWLRVKLAG